MIKDLREAQEIEIKLLKEFIRICEKYNISYWLDSGTLIGTVRHKGFIPWDDDIDVGMDRKNYEKFLQVVQREISEDFCFILPGTLNNGAYFDVIPKIMYINNEFHKETEQDNYYQNITNRCCLDIFIADEISDNKLMRRIKLTRLCLIYMMLMGHRYEINYKKYTPCLSVIVMILSNIGKFISTDKLCKKYNRVAKGKAGTNSKNVILSNYPLNEISHLFNRADYAELIYAEFEGLKVKIPRNYDCVLTELYGNYMELPPIEERVPLHFK